MNLLNKLYKVLNTEQKSNKPLNNIVTQDGKTDGLPEGRTEVKKVQNPQGETEKNPVVRKKLTAAMDKGTMTKKHPKKGYQ